jgi:predicted Zn-dependent protease
MTKPIKDTSEFSPEEVRQRFEAALRGARIAGPQHNESVTPKRAKPQQKKKSKKAKV